jgi:hypothetical protein
MLSMKLVMDHQIELPAKFVQNKYLLDILQLLRKSINYNSSVIPTLPPGP